MIWSSNSVEVGLLLLFELSFTAEVDDGFGAAFKFAANFASRMMRQALLVAEAALR